MPVMQKGENPPVMRITVRCPSLSEGGLTEDFSDLNGMKVEGEREDSKTK